MIENAKVNFVAQVRTGRSNQGKNGMHANSNRIQQVGEIVRNSVEAGDDWGKNESKLEADKNKNEVPAVIKETSQKNWANLFVRNKLASKGMDLNFIAPAIKNGEVIVELCKEEVEEQTRK